MFLINTKVLIVLNTVSLRTAAKPQMTNTIIETSRYDICCIVMERPGNICEDTAEGIAQLLKTPADFELLISY